jgi:hypothetical protein
MSTSSSTIFFKEIPQLSDETEAEPDILSAATNNAVPKKRQRGDSKFYTKQEVYASKPEADEAVSKVCTL